MTDISEELVERLGHHLYDEYERLDPGIGECEEWGELTERERELHRLVARSAIRAVLDWQAKEWVEIPRLDRGGE